MKKPQTPYFLFLQANRKKIEEAAGSKSPKVLAAKASEMWKNAPADEKKKFEDQFAAAKKTYDEFCKTEEGQKMLADKKDNKKGTRAGKMNRKLTRKVKAAAKSVQKDEKLKKPTTAFWMWSVDSRDKIIADLKENGKDCKLSDIAKAAGVMWAALAADLKAPYEEKAKKAKEEYAAFCKSEEGAAALKAHKDAVKAAKQEAKDAFGVEGADEKTEKPPKGARTAAKLVKKDEKLKRPHSAYWMWLADNREKIIADLKENGKDCGVARVATAAGAMWAALDANVKAPYEEKAKKAKEEFETFCKSEEGSAALKAHKDAVKAAKNEIKAVNAKPKPETASPKKRRTTKKQGTPAKKRVGKDNSAETPEKKKAKGRGKGKIAAKGAGVAKKNVFDEAIIQEADKLGFATLLENLANRPEIVDKNFSGQQILAALKSSDGLVNKAKACLLGGA